MNGNFVEDFEIFVAENVGCDLDRLNYIDEGIETHEQAEAFAEKLREEYKSEESIKMFCDQYDYEFDPKYIEECYKAVDRVIDGGPEYDNMPPLADEIMNLLFGEDEDN